MREREREWRLIFIKRYTVARHGVLQHTHVQLFCSYHLTHAPLRPQVPNHLACPSSVNEKGKSSSSSPPLRRRSARPHHQPAQLRLPRLHHMAWQPGRPGRSGRSGRPGRLEYSTRRLTSPRCAPLSSTPRGGSVPYARWRTRTGLTRVRPAARLATALRRRRRRQEVTPNLAYMAQQQRDREQQRHSQPPRRRPLPTLFLRARPLFISARSHCVWL